MNRLVRAKKLWKTQQANRYVLCLVVTSAVSPAFAGLDSIKLVPERTVLRADGLSTSVITADVYDDRGNPIADGTRVLFTTTAGRLDSSVAVTQGGVARVTLTSSNQAGEALISVDLDTPGLASPEHITITFSRDADAAETTVAWAHLDGAYVAYALESNTIQANGKGGLARVQYRDVTLTADVLQVDLSQNLIKALNNVTLTRNGVTRTYRSLRYSLLQGQGLGERINDGRLQTVVLGGAKLDETAPAPGTRVRGKDLWNLTDLSDDGITVVCKSLALRPNDTLQFRSATFYLDGERGPSFPYHIMKIGQKTLFADDVLGIGPNGPMVNYPYYYDVNPSTVGTLHLRDGAPIGTSAYSTRPGINIGLSQTYNGPQNMEGSVNVDGITRSGWIAQIHHGQRLDATTTGSLFVDMSELNSMFATTQLTRSYSHFQLNATGSASRASGEVDPTTGIRGDASGSASGQINAQSYSKPLLGDKFLYYTLTADASRQSFFGGNTAVSQGLVNTEGLGTRLNTTPLPIAHMTTFSQSVSVTQEWVQGSAATGNGVPESGISLLGTSTITRAISHLGSTSLTYDYTQQPTVLTSGIASTTAGNGKQRLAIGVSFAQSNLWNFTFMGSRGLDVDQTTMYSTLGFRIVGDWRGNLIFNDTRINGVEYQDMEYRLTTRLSFLPSKDFSLDYSTTAKRVQVDMSAVAF